MSAVQVPKQGFLEKLTQAVYLDYVLKFGGVTGFVVTYLNAWHGLGMATKLGFLASAAAWFVGARFTRIYR
jgi:hypothetical protein